MQSKKLTQPALGSSVHFGLVSLNLVLDDSIKTSYFPDEGRLGVVHDGDTRCSSGSVGLQLLPSTGTVSTILRSSEVGEITYR